MAERELYLHLTSEGPKVIRDGVETLRDKVRVCFYVHGYNVSPPEGKESFDRLLENVRREARVDSRLSVPALDGAEAWRVYWPAFARLARDRWTLSALTYPLHARQVEDWAEVFASYLDSEFGKRNATPAEVTFVGHSLGCRLILETLRYKLQYKHRNWTVRSVLFMAAAVPVSLLEFDARLCRAVLVPELRFVAYSPADLVLQLAFRFGQMFERGVLPHAVGSFGAPSVVWSKRLRTMNGHSGYFADPKTARFIAAAIGLLAFRDIDARVIARAPGVTRAAPAATSISSRGTRKRRIGE